MESKLPVSDLRPEPLAESLNELYGNKLTPEEAAEAKDNLLQFFELLIQIDKSNEEQSNEKQESLEAAAI